MTFYSLRTSTASIALILSAGLSTPALAADPATPAAEAADSDGLTEIIVTAQKREENLQQTPISISVLSGADLANRRVVSLLDLGDGAIPSLKVAPFFSRPGALIVNIRGVGILSDSNQPARDQGVGVYVDGVYLGRAQGLGTALFDVANIEVLKGPQGTLFGRNTIGGAVNITTKRPTGEFGGRVVAGVGNYGSYRGELHVDFPEVANVSFKVDAVLSKRDPFITNPLAGANGFNSYDKRGLHVEWLWKPSSDFSANFSFDTSYDATSSLYYHQLSPGLGLPAAGPGSPLILPNTRAAAYVSEPNRVSVAAIGVPQLLSVGKASGTRLTLEWNATPQLTLKSISSYRAMTQGQSDNGSASTTLQQATITAGVTPSFAGLQFSRLSFADFRQNQVSQEFQVIGDFDRLKFAAGGLYYQERVQDNARAYNTNQFTDAAGSISVLRQINFDTQVIQRASHVVTTSIGAFGQATYTPDLAGDMFHLTAGARWTRDKKDGNLFTINGASPVVPVGGVNVVGPILFSRSWSRIDPMVNLMIDVTPDVHVYGKWGTGYRSGGANSRSLSYRTFDPETVSIFEVGFKGEFFDRRARLNVAAYTGTYKGIQLDFFGLYEDVINGVRVATTRTTSDTVNAPGTGRVRGLEAELTIAPTRGLTLSASYAYNYVNIPATVNPLPQSGGVFITVPVPNYQVYTPEHSASAALDYEVPVGPMTLRTHFDINYDSGYYAQNTDVEYDSITRAVRFAQVKGDKSLLVNARIALADIALGSGDTSLTVAAWARNLFNEEHVFYKTASPRAGAQGFFNDPRTFGIEGIIKF